MPTTTHPLREARTKSGLGLRETARRAGIDPGQLSRTERGLGELTLDSFVRVMQVLGQSRLADEVSRFTRTGECHRG